MKVTGKNAYLKYYIFLFAINLRAFTQQKKQKKEDIIKNIESKMVVQKYNRNRFKVSTAETAEEAETCIHKY